MAMEIREQIDADIKAAMKSGAKDKVSALRMLSAALKYKQIDKRAPLEDSEVLDSVRSLIKQRKDSAEVAILEVYLPHQLVREEVEKLVREAIAQTSAQGAKDMGKVMKALVPLLAGRADNKLVSELVKSSLG
jgi:uncharacterized protein YqeY